MGATNKQKGKGGERRGKAMEFGFAFPFSITAYSRPSRAEEKERHSSICSASVPRQPLPTQKGKERIPWPPPICCRRFDQSGGGKGGFGTHSPLAFSKSR